MTPSQPPSMSVEYVNTPHAVDREKKWDLYTVWVRLRDGPGCHFDLPKKACTDETLLRFYVRDWRECLETFFREEGPQCSCPRS